MRIGAIVPNDGSLPRQIGLGRMAATAERAGAASLWVSDHLLMVDAPTSRYPYSPDGRQTWSNEIDYLEALACCAYMAATTRDCRIGTAVLVLPQRNVLELAKVAASIDQLSGGRLVLGVGAGWNAAEMQALGYGFTDRGGRFDEMLDVLSDCWTGRPSAFSGRFVDVPPDIVLHPRPVSPSGPPLLVGGMSDPALRRAARRGAGWIALASAESFDGEVLRERLLTLERLRRDYGRAGPFEMVLKLHASPKLADSLPALAVQAQRLGFDELVVEPPWELGSDAAGEAIAAVLAATS
ncbi:MAG TPA: TIGR03619 family F420-dependent LLM class oxidoreductase [Solirubrobacteraceae bacterium]|nr:TIGR03619 family F420-dependent LLM class oxidoreductase [Solirubrobacteraceae bacterium]